MREMGIQAIYSRQNASKPKAGHKVYSYLLKGLNIYHPDYVWSIDITYIPVRTDWLYLAAIIDWFSRYVLHWELDDSMEIDFVLDTSRKALKISTPEIMNSDQGSHFTNPQYTQLFLNAGVKISMDTVAGHMTTSSLRDFGVLLNTKMFTRKHMRLQEARIGIHNFLRYYNHERPHFSIGYCTPEEMYWSR